MATKRNLKHSSHEACFHTWTRTTQRSESTNAHIKGQGDLSDVLADATLVQTHLIIDRMSRETHRNAVEELIRLRRANKRVSQYYEDHCEHSIRLAGQTHQFYR
jgi:hypothetical protein